MIAAPAFGTPKYQAAYEKARERHMRNLDWFYDICGCGVDRPRKLSPHSNDLVCDSCYARMTASIAEKAQSERLAA